MAEKPEVKYTLDHLMRVCSEAEFLGEKVYLRTLSARQDELRTQKALSWAREYRHKLRDKGSEEYALHIAPLLCTTIEELQDDALAAERIRLSRQSFKDVHEESEPKLDDDSDLQKVLDEEDKEEEEQKRLAERRQKWIEEQLESFRKLKLEGHIAEGIGFEPEWVGDTLRDEVVKGRISLLTDVEYSKRYNDTTLFYGCFRDEKRSVPYFASVEEVNESAPILKDFLFAAYRALDIFSSDHEQLKNLPRGQ